MWRPIIDPWARVSFHKQTHNMCATPERPTVIWKTIDSDLPIFSTGQIWPPARLSPCELMTSLDDVHTVRHDFPPFRFQHFSFLWIEGRELRPTIIRRHSGRNDTGLCASTLQDHVVVWYYALQGFSNWLPPGVSERAEHSGIPKSSLGRFK